MSGGRSLLVRRRGNVWLRTGAILFIAFFVWIHLDFLTSANTSVQSQDFANESNAIFYMVPSVLHKFLTPRPRNSTHANGSIFNTPYGAPLNISEIKKTIAQYNLQQTVYNEDIFGPLQNDSVIIVVQVGKIHSECSSTIPGGISYRYTIE